MRGKLQAISSALADLTVFRDFPPDGSLFAAVKNSHNDIACKPTGLPILEGGLLMLRSTRVRRIFKSALITAAVVITTSFLFPTGANAQGLAFDAGWSHVTGNFGMDGFTLGSSWFFTPKLAVAANYDDAWNTDRVGNFAFTSVGAIATKSHLQDFLVGPRYFFSSYDVAHNHTIIPFVDVRFGVTHLHQEVQEGITPAAINQDSAFSWLIGGGVDYPLTPHWMARGELGLLRTHLNAQPESHARLAISIAYLFGSR